MLLGKRKNNGFSLFELLIVIVILGIVSATIYIRWPESTSTLDQETAILVSNIRYTQNLSMSRNERCQFRINTNDNSYQILDKNNNPLPIPLAKETRKEENEKIINLTHPIVFDSIEPKTNTIIFDSKGSPFYKTNEEEKKPNDDIKITLSIKSSTQTRTITIDDITGRISS